MCFYASGATQWSVRVAACWELQKLNPVRHTCSYKGLTFPNLTLSGKKSSPSVTWYSAPLCHRFLQMGFFPKPCDLWKESTVCDPMNTPKVKEQACFCFWACFLMFSLSGTQSVSVANKKECFNLSSRSVLLKLVHHILRTFTLMLFIPFWCEKS